MIYSEQVITNTSIQPVVAPSLNIVVLYNYQHLFPLAQREDNSAIVLKTTAVCQFEPLGNNDKKVTLAQRGVVWEQTVLHFTLFGSGSVEQSVQYGNATLHAGACRNFSPTAEKILNFPFWVGKMFIGFKCSGVYGTPRFAFRVSTQLYYIVSSMRFFQKSWVQQCFCSVRLEHANQS